MEQEPPRISAYTLYFSKIELQAYILCWWYGSTFIEIFLVGSVKRIFSARVTFQPFKVIQGHWLWYESTARMPLPIMGSRIRAFDPYQNHPLVRYSNLGPILPIFIDIAGFLLKSWPHPNSTRIFRMLAVELTAGYMARSLFINTFSTMTKLLTSVVLNSIAYC